MAFNTDFRIGTYRYFLVPLPTKMLATALHHCSWRHVTPIDNTGDTAVLTLPARPGRRPTSAGRLNGEPSLLTNSLRGRGARASPPLRPPPGAGPCQSGGRCGRCGAVHGVDTGGRRRAGRAWGDQTTVSGRGSSRCGMGRILKVKVLKTICHIMKISRVHCAYIAHI